MQNPLVELNAICFIMNQKSPEFLAKLDGDLFDNKDLKNVFRLIQGFYLQSGQFPGWDTLTADVVKRCNTKDKSEFLSSLLLQVRERGIQGLTEDSLLRELQDFKKLRLLLESSGELVSAIQRKDAKQAVASLKSAYDRVCVSSEYNLDECTVDNLFQDDTKYMFTTTGIKDLDKRGPLINKGLTILAGSYGAGKSVVSLQVAIHSYLKYQSNVSYHSYELSKEEIKARIISNISDVDLGNIISGNLTKDELLKVRKASAEFVCIVDNTIEDFCKQTLDEPLKEFYNLLYNQYEKRPNKFYVFDELSNWDELLIKLDLLAATRNVNFTVIDYITLVPYGKMEYGMARWEYILLKNQQLKEISKKYNFKNILLPLQFNDKQDELKFATNLANAVDLYLKITQDDDDKELNTVTVNYGKFRNFLSIKGEPTLQPFKLLRSFDRSKFENFSF